MPDQDSIVCPDCGAAYQCTQEQLGKLLRCKCGRYLVTGGHNHKSPSAPKPEEPSVAKLEVPAPPKEPVIGVKAPPPPPPMKPAAEPPISLKTVPPPPAPKTKPVSPETVFEPEAASATSRGNSKNLMMAIAAVALVAAFGLAYVLFKPSAMASAAKPVPVETSAAATSVTPSSSPCSGNAVHLENGTSLGHSYLGNGMGRLEVENTTSSDVAVRVTGSADVTVAWFYVLQGQSVTIDNLPLGTMRVLVASGTDWDAQNLTFKCNDAYAAFEKPLEYIDRREDDHTTYSAYKLTLGKQRTAAVSREEFFKGHIGAGR